MLEQDDSKQDMDMISTVLRKVADEMEQMESDRIMPDHMKPKVEVAHLSMGAGIPNPNENKAETFDQAEPETQMNQHEPLDPAVLKELMDKAGQADDEGATEDDHLDEFDPEIAALIRKKKETK